MSYNDINKIAEEMQDNIDLNCCKKYPNYPKKYPKIQPEHDMQSNDEYMQFLIENYAKPQININKISKPHKIASPKHKQNTENNQKPTKASKSGFGISSRRLDIW